MIVGPEGPLNAKIVIIGEAPGAEEEKAGRPFIGGSGQILSQVLAKAGIDRNQCYITNIMQVRPPGNDFGLFYDDTKRANPGKLLASGIERLHQELSGLRPNIILPLGSEPLRAITGHRSIEKWRGSILDTRFGKAVPSYHPAAVLRDYSLRPILQMDVQRVARQSTSPTHNVRSHRFHIDSTFEFTLEWLRKIRSGQLISFDIETVGDLIRCLGIGISADEAMCVPFMSSPYRLRANGTNEIPAMISFETGETPFSTSRVSSHWNEDQEYEILREFDRIFSDPGIEKVAQNFPFDATRLEKQFGLVCRGLRLDTMLGFHCCYCELPKGLDFLCSIYTEVPYYSDYNVASDFEVWKYNCYDAAVTWEIVAPIERDMQAHDVKEFYQNHIQPAMLALTRAGSRGIRVNRKVKDEFREKLLLEIEYPHKKKKWTKEGTLTKELRAYAGMPDLNPNSPQQLCELFYTKFKMSVQYDHKTKRPTTGEKARDKLRRLHPQHVKLFDLMDEWSEKETLVTSFLSRELDALDKMRTLFSLSTVTGRIASGKPLEDTDEAFTNLTNIPRGDFRRMFLPDEDDEVLIKADLKSAEWMVVCWKCPIDRYIQRYKENPDWDIHRYAGSKVYGKDEINVTKVERSNAKNGVYGSNYAMQAPRASQTWKVPIQEADFILRRWRQETPEISEKYWKKIRQSIETTRSIVNALGRKRMFFDRINFPPSDLDQIFRDAYSHYAQSTVADLINRAFALMDHFFDPRECRVLLQVHDEIVASCKKKHVEKYVKLFKSFMQYPLKFPETEVPLVIQAEVTVGPTWFDQEPLEKWKEKNVIFCPSGVS
jgi:uracil-DNA glycosylase family 4